MSSYFDAKEREVAEAAGRFGTDERFLGAVAAIEEEMYRDVCLVTGDREFPEDLREEIMTAFAVHAVFKRGALEPQEKTVDYVLRVRSSRVIDRIYYLFHDVARRRIQTRFGRLSDNPSMILALRAEYDEARR